MKRSVLSAVLVLCLLFGLAPPTLAADPAGGTVDGLRWSLSEDGTLTVGGSGAIPDYNKYGEASPDIVSRPWHQYRHTVKRLVVQEGVTRIGSRAFQNFEKLESAVLPESVGSIGAWAFQNCYALTDLTLPEGVSLDTGAFRDAPAEADAAATESAEYRGSVYFERLAQVELTGSFRDDMIAVALSQKGYHEGDGAADLGGGSKNGDGDYTEYGRYLGSVGNAWCSEFASWCVRMAGVPTDVLKSSTSAKAKTYTEDTVSTYYGWNGLVYGGGGYTPRKGDLLLWAWDLDEHGLDEHVSHTSILMEARRAGNTVTFHTVEGNNGGKVKEDEFTVNAADGTLTDGSGRLYYLVAPDYENAGVRRREVSFDGNGGSDGRSAKQVAVGGLYGALPLAERSGDTFLGWYTERTGGKRVNMYTPVRLNAGQTLYAHWKSGSTGGNAPTPSGVSVTVNGAPVVWTDAQPFIDANGRTMVPLRAVGDALGLSVGWNGEAREASFTDGAKAIFFPIGSNSARAGLLGTIPMDTAAVIVNDRTYAPVRCLAEYFGYSVGWDGASRTVLITGK